jgi:DNA-directed RNA polymerase specialized sigma24 family protein
VLSKFQELRYQEIASILDISEGAVKVRVHRAMSQLKNAYLQIAN